MGASFGSIHVRTDDRDAVKKVAEKVAKKRRCKFLISPAIAGWVAVYPSRHGHDEAVSKAMADLEPSWDIIHVVLHDEDIFAYGFYRGGKLIDEYNSNPDYFRKVPEEDRERQRGRPEVFAEHLGGRLGEIEAMLHTRVLNEWAMLTEFSRAMGLSNVETAYEYLIDDETDRVDRFAEFIAVPDREAERGANAAHGKQLEEVKEEWKRRGILLAEQRGRIKDRFTEWPFASAAGEKRFLVCWQGQMLQKPAELMMYDGPDYATPVGTGLQVDPQAHNIKASARERYCLISHAAGRWNSELWDVARRQRVMAIHHPSHSTAIGVFSPDEELLVTRSSDEIHLIYPPDLKIRSIETRGQGRLVALHPSKEYAVVDAMGQAVVIDLKEGRAIKRLLVGGRYDAATSMRAKFEAALKQIEDAAQRAAYQRQMEAAMNAMSAIGREKRDGHGNETLRGLVFSDDGKWLLAATSMGARAYAWEAILAAEDDSEMPRPVYAAEAEPVTYELSPGHDSTEARTNAVAYDARRNHMVFAGIEGKIRSVDLESGVERTLLEVPGRPPISYLDLSADAEVICLRFAPVHFERSPKTPWEMQFWRVEGLAL